MIFVEIAGQIAGGIGFVLVLVAYGFLSKGIFTHQSRLYHLFNFLGASSIFVNAYIQKAWPIVVLEGVWALVGLKHFIWRPV